MNAALAVALSLLVGVGLLGGLALWLGARLGAHLVDQLWDAFKDHRL